MAHKNCNDTHKPTKGYIKYLLYSVYTEDIQEVVCIVYVSLLWLKTMRP